MACRHLRGEFCWPQFIPLCRPEYTETVCTRGQERVWKQLERIRNDAKAVESRLGPAFGTVSKNDKFWRSKKVRKSLILCSFSPLQNSFEPASKFPVWPQLIHFILNGKILLRFVQHQQNKNFRHIYAKYILGLMVSFLTIAIIWLFFFVYCGAMVDSGADFSVPIKREKPKRNCLIPFRLI